MKITEFSIKHNEAVIILCISLVAFGIFCYLDLPRESFPEVDFPLVIVNTTLDGGNPEDIEKSVTIPLETELDTVKGLKEMRSVSASSSGLSKRMLHKSSQCLSMTVAHGLSASHSWRRMRAS